MSVFFIALGLILLIVVIYYMVIYFRKVNPVTSIGDESYPLSKLAYPQSSVEFNKAWGTGTGGTLFFYIQPQIANRTAQVGNEYAKAVQLGGQVDFCILIAPDAGRSSGLAPCQLKIYTRSTTTPVETLDIFNVPLQSWSAVAIVKQGRQFNVYVNGKLTATHTCLAMPVTPSGSLILGDQRLAGTIALLNMATVPASGLSAPMSSSDILRLFETTSDANGNPYLSSGPRFPLPSFSCPGGLCTMPKAPGPLESWAIQYG